MSIFNTKRMTGMTEKTVEHFVLGAGVFAKNFIPGTDTYEGAKAAGKLLGATTGGGEFKAAKQTTIPTTIIERDIHSVQNDNFHKKNKRTI